MTRRVGAVLEDVLEDSETVSLNEQGLAGWAAGILAISHATGRVAATTRERSTGQGRSRAAATARTKKSRFLPSGPTSPRLKITFHALFGAFFLLPPVRGRIEVGGQWPPSSAALMVS